MTYRSAMGKTVDMDKLRQQNQNVRAVGNMNVNARGDVLDSHNNVINDGSKRVNQMYRNAMENGGRLKRRYDTASQLVPDATPVQAQPVPVPPTVVEEPEFLEEEMEFDMDVEEPVDKPPVPTTTKKK